MGLWAPRLLHKEQKCDRVQVVVTSDMLIYYHFVNTLNSLRPRGTIRWHGYGSSLVWVIIGSGNGLLPDSIKPLPVPVFTGLIFDNDNGNDNGNDNENRLLPVTTNVHIHNKSMVKYCTTAKGAEALAYGPQQEYIDKHKIYSSLIY